VGPGVAEIRIHTGGEHRVLYLAKFEEAVYVLHAFEKRSRRTARLNREVGRKRLREAVRSRSARK
jgi:phage-related protein